MITSQAALSLAGSRQIGPLAYFANTYFPNCKQNISNNKISSYCPMSWCQEPEDNNTMFMLVPVLSLCVFTLILTFLCVILFSWYFIFELLIWVQNTLDTRPDVISSLFCLRPLKKMSLSPLLRAALLFNLLRTVIEMILLKDSYLTDCGSICFEVALKL